VTRSTRLLALLQALRGRRRPVTAAALARELEVSERTIYRDLSELTSQGAPIQGEAGVGYILGPGLFLPPLMLTEDETEAILLGLRYVDQHGDEVLTNAGRSARAKITSVLSRELQATVEAPLSVPGPDGGTFPKMPYRSPSCAPRSERGSASSSNTPVSKRSPPSVSFGRSNSASWTRLAS